MINEIVIDLTGANRILIKAEPTRNGLNCELIVSDENIKLRAKIKETDFQALHDLICKDTGYRTYSELEDEILRLQSILENQRGESN